MKRYIIDKAGLEYLNKTQVDDAITKLASDEVITNETLVYRNLNSVSLVLSGDEVKVLLSNNIRCEEQQNKEGITLGGDYAKYQTKFIPKISKGNITGVGCKVAVLDSGCTLTGTPHVSEVWNSYSTGYNFIDSNTTVTDNFNHGTRVASSIVSSCGWANGCTLYILKCISDAGSGNEAAFLAAIDYCIDNNIDIICTAFDYSTTAFNSAIADAIAAGIVVVGATGNSTTDATMAGPAILSGVVAINAIKEDGTVHYKNKNGKQVDFAISGYDCEGINNAGTFGNGFGTSFSTPVFCGLFACYKQKYGLTGSALMAVIRKKAIKSDSVPYFGKLLNFCLLCLFSLAVSSQQVFRYHKGSGVRVSSSAHTVFQLSDVPDIPFQNDAEGIEIGMKFSATIGGNIIGARYYKGTGQTGTKAAHLWTRTGTLLATGTFTGETASGWQQVLFSSPIGITASTTYVISFFSPNGHYARDEDYFNSAKINGYLRGLANGEDGSNGVYIYNATSAFPTGTYLKSNYWIDVLFNPSLDVTAPTVTAVTPLNSATDVSIGTAVTATFSEAMIAITTATMELRNPATTLITSTVSYNAGTKVATLTPNSSLANNTVYTAKVLTGAEDIAGNNIASDYTWTFTTVAIDATPPTAPTISATGQTETTITVAMTGATDNIAVTGYDIYVDGVLEASNQSTPYTITGLTAATDYAIKAKSKDAAGNASVSFSNEITHGTDEGGSCSTTLEGFGTTTTGGAGGSTVHVTNLNATGAGSLHAALSSGTSTRTIVFDVGGTISNFSFRGGNVGATANITIDGTTAPSPGITLDGGGGQDVLSFENSNNNNIIVKSIRVINGGNDNINVLDGAHDIVFTHCSSYDAADGNLDVAGGVDVTIQYCLLGPSATGGPGPMLITASNVTVHHNLFSPRKASTPGERAPYAHANYVASGNPNADIRNNLIWKFGRSNGAGSGYGTAIAYGAKANVINNYYYTAGTSTNSATNLDDGYGAGDVRDGDSEPSEAYIAGNVSGNGNNPNTISNHAIYTVPTVTTQSACAAAALVLSCAGPKFRNSTENAWIADVNIQINGGCP